MIVHKGVASEGVRGERHVQVKLFLHVHDIDMSLREAAAGISDPDAVTDFLNQKVLQFLQAYLGSNENDRDIRDLWAAVNNLDNFIQKIGEESSDQNIPLIAPAAAGGRRRRKRSSRKSSRRRR